jgi:hypothetical protein
MRVREVTLLVEVAKDGRRLVTVVELASPLPA